MTKEELLRPRWKVIAEFPDSSFILNEIIESDTFTTMKDYKYKMECFPALFKKLEWWEERDEKDMPEYLKYKGTDYLRYGSPQVNEIVKVESFCEDSVNSKYGCDWIIFYEPATEEEFLNQ